MNWCINLKEFGRNMILLRTLLFKIFHLRKTKKDEATIVGIILIGVGSSWYQGTDEVKVGVQCAKICKQDWNI